MKVLVVEDDPRISDVLDYALKADGYELVRAQRGREAIELAIAGASKVIEQNLDDQANRKIVENFLSSIPVSETKRG